MSAATQEGTGVGGLSTQVLIELRKAIDTRPGQALALLAILGGVLGAVFARGFTQPDSLSDVAKIAVSAPLVTVPLIGLRITAAEWAHRGVQHTFTQNPRRAEVLTAKLCAVALLTAMTWMVSMVAAIAVAVGLGVESTGTEDIVLLSAMLALQLAAMFGAAIGAALMSVWTSCLVVLVAALLMLPGINETLGASAPWASLPRHVHQLVNGLWIDLVSFLVMSLLWLVLPLVVATWRWLRRDILH